MATMWIWLTFGVEDAGNVAYDITEEMEIHDDVDNNTCHQCTNVVASSWLCWPILAGTGH